MLAALRGLGDSGTTAIQNVVGSHAGMLAPQRLVLAATVIGVLGREGEVARVMLSLF